MITVTRSTGGSSYRCKIILWTLTFRRDYSGHEADFIMGDEIAVEIKSAEEIPRHDVHTVIVSTT